MARKKLPHGWVEGSVQDLLGLADHEAAIVEMRVQRRVRGKRGRPKTRTSRG